MVKEYFEQIYSKLQLVLEQEENNLNSAAKKMAESIQNGGIIHLFGCGHSHILTEEVFYRAGGLVPIHPIFHEPLMLHEGAVTSSTLERKNDYAENFMNDQDIRSNDLVIVISTSGRNPVPIDAALIAQEKGAYVVGITSIEYSKSQPSRHKSGKHLADAVHLVINNHAPKGDALLTYEKVEASFSPASTVIGATILNAIIAESIKIMADNGFAPPIFKSGNIEGSDEHNQQLIKKYQERIPLLS